MHQTQDIIASFDRYLEARGLHFDAVVIGGAALNLLGVDSRLTKDCDILFPEIPEQIAKASQTFAREVRGNVGDLGDEWLNNGPASLQTQLPPGWDNRLQTAFSGRAIHLRTLAREDLLCAKLFALCDRGIDLLDCVALAPSGIAQDRSLAGATGRQSSVASACSCNDRESCKEARLCPSVEPPHFHR